LSASPDFTVSRSGLIIVGIYRSGCFVTANERELVEHTSLGQPWCRIGRAALAAEGADAAPLAASQLPKRRPNARSAQAKGRGAFSR
jgi:hypothetical protein